MKTIITENQRGFLFQNGVFLRLLAPGRHYIKQFLGQNAIMCNAEGRVLLNGIDVSVLLKDRQFVESVSTIEVPDNCIAIHYEDGRVTGAENPGTYYFWNIFHKHTFELIDISDPEITQVSAQTLQNIPEHFYSRVDVPEGSCVLLYFDGRFQKQLASGSHCFWSNHVKITYQLVDLRAQQLDIAGQEILTADKVSLRLNFVCTYRVTNPVEIVSRLKEYKTQIHITTQLVLREYVGKYRFDELLEQKDEIAGFVLEKLREKQDGLFVEFLDAGLKDIILPGEIRDIMNMVLIAEKKAQANVISRREEVASTRSLLNTAKLMEENATLYKLKELEYIEKICDRVGNISLGNGNLLSQLGEILTAR